MRILFVSNYYPPFEVGGYEQLCRDVAERLAQRGHEVAVLTSNHGIEAGRELNEPGVFRQLKPQMNYRRALGPAWSYFSERRSNIRDNLAQLESVLDEYAPEIVFIWNLQQIPRDVATYCEGRPDLVVAYWLAGYTPAEPDEYWRYWEHVPANRVQRLAKRPIRHLALRMMEAEGKPVHPKMANVAVVSQTMKKRGIAAGTLPADAQVIYNGVEFEAFYSPVEPRGNRRMRVLQAGRVGPDKGVHTSLAAIKHLVEIGRGDQVELVVAGSGPAEYEQSLRRYVTEYKLEDQVVFLGWLPRQQMPGVMRECQVLSLPSLYPEAFARVVLEAMAAGLVVVGSSAGGTPELIEDDVNGYIFEANDDLALARRLQTLMDDDDLRQRLAIKGQQQVSERFTLENMVDQIEAFLEVSVTSSTLKREHA